jgi:hypothetical protein
MTVFVFADNARSSLAANVGPSATTITLIAGGGAKFPAPAAGQQFALTLNDLATKSVYEVCYCTSRSGDVLTVLRGQEGTTANSWISGDLAWNGPTNGQQGAMVQHPQMLDGSISPLFGSLSTITDVSVGRDELVGRNKQVNGFSTTLGPTYFGGTGQFYAFDAGGGNRYVNFESGSFLQFLSGTGFALTTPGHIQLIAPSNVDVSAPALTVSGGLRAGAAATGSGDANHATLLADFPQSISRDDSFPGNSFVWSRLPNGLISIMGHGQTAVGDGDTIAFGFGGFPNACLQMVVCDGNVSTNWVIAPPSGRLPVIWSCQSFTNTTFQVSAYRQPNPTAPWQPAGLGLYFRYHAIGY